jgi:hypothetical protein
MTPTDFVKRVKGGYEVNIPIRKYFHTCGDGHWSKVAKRVFVQRIQMDVSEKKKNYDDDDDDDEDDAYDSDISIFFTKCSWNIMEYGLIYTDSLFIKEIREYLKSIGFDSEAVDDIHYSEQGMQGKLRVSCDAYKFADHIRDLMNSM